MSIYKSGLVNAVFVVCVKPLSESDKTFEVGKKYELVLDMGAMYVLKTPNGQDTVVPKDRFAVASDS